MTWGELFRYVLFIVICIGLAALVVYLIRNAIKSGNASALLKNVADQVMNIRKKAEAEKTEVEAQRQAAQEAATAKAAKETAEHEEEQKQQAEALLANPDELSHFLVHGDHKSKPS